MIRKALLLLAAFSVLQSCAGSSPSNQATAQNPAENPAENPANPTAPRNTPGDASPESADFFSAIDRAIAASATGDRFVAERFNVLIARLSVYALICDPRNDRGYSVKFSRLYNRATDLQALSNRVYGSETAAYNRLEKQRNIESYRLSFQSAPNVCDCRAGTLEIQAPGGTRVI